MLKKILIGLAVLVALFVVVVAMQPSEFHVERTATIAAPPADVFAQVNDLHKWDAWSPWAKLDPNAKIAFEGPEAGQGAAMSWAGNDKVGEGKMTMVESRPSEAVKLKVDFVKPFEGTSNSDFALKPEGDGHGRHLGHVRPSQFHGEGVLPGDERQEDDRRRHGEGPGAAESGARAEEPGLTRPVSRDLRHRRALAPVSWRRP